MLQVRSVLIYLLLTVMLLSGCQPIIALENSSTIGPMPPVHIPSLGPNRLPTRILIIGSLFAEHLDTYLQALAEEANPMVALEISSIILPAT